MAEFAYNNSKQASTSLSPFYLNYGFHPSIPTTIQPTNTTVAAVEDFMIRMNNLLKIAQDNISQAQLQQARYANQHRRDEQFSVGDNVLVSSENINLPSQVNRPTRKFQAKFLGPYKVIETVSPTAYRLELPETLKIHPVFHISNLRRYVESDEQLFPERTVPPPPPLVFDDDHVEYLVEKILDKRIRRIGRGTRTEYLVKWKNYPEYDATWQTLADLENAKEAVQNFEEEQRNF